MQRLWDFKLDNVTITVPGGTILGLIGENGAGKTTVIKSILNLIGRDGGDIQIFGQDNVRCELAISGAKDELLERYGRLACTKAAFRRRYPDLTVDAVSLEEIMVFTVKGDTQ